MHWTDMKKKLLALAAGLFVCAAQEQEPDSPPDYNELKHSVTVTKLRAGVYDEEQKSTFFFTLRLLSSSTKKEPSKENQEDDITADLGEFGEVELEQLDQKTAEDLSDENFRFEIGGNKIRELIIATMQRYDVTEKEVTISATVELWQRKRKYYVLPDNQKREEISYTIISPNQPFEKQPLTITNPNGTFVTILVAPETTVSDGDEAASDSATGAAPTKSVARSEAPSE